jgi:murein DD-endopeptidase MepM/ murein hydrolase activator NlpD
VALLAALTAPLQAVAAPWDDQQRQLDGLNSLIGQSEAQLRQFQSQIAVVRGALRQLEAKLGALQRELTQQQAHLDDLEAQIQKKTAELRLKEAELERHKQQLERRTRFLYKTGGPISTMSLAFSASSFSDLLDRLFAMQDIVQADNRLVNRLRMDRAAIEGGRAEIAQKRDTQSQVVAQMRGNVTEMEGVKGQQEAALQTLRHAEQVQANYIAEKQRAAERLASEIKRLKAAWGSGIFMWPLWGTITQEFGCTDYIYEPRDPRCHPRRFHSGIDIAAAYGSPVAASDSGRAYTRSFGGYGNHVIIAHQHGDSFYWTVYAHLSGFAIADGVVVAKGEVIGYEGSTGASSGPHLHFEIRVRDGYDGAVNPRLYIPQF